jgi:hypothetical protein
MTRPGQASMAEAAEWSHLALRRAVMDVAVSLLRADTETAVSLLVAAEEAAEAELRAAALG